MHRPDSIPTLLALLVAGLVVAPPAATATQEPKLVVAARNGDLPEVRRLLEAGAPVDAADRWGSTALAFAVAKRHTEVVALLLERGADPNLRESFFNTSPLDHALGVMGEPDFDLAARLLRAGADDRARALEVALAAGHAGLAEAAVTSGPLPESEAAHLRSRFSSAGAELGAILGRIETRPDPPPPTYSVDDLRSFTGHFEGWTSDADVEVELREGALALTLREGSPRAESAGKLTAVAERTFRTADGEVTATFFGRAGLVEGVALDRPGMPTLALRRSVAEPTATAPAGSSDDGAVPLPGHAPSDDRASSAAAREPTVHWPGFRGANVAGVGDGASAPVHWDLERGTNVAWIAELPGLGNSSPVVWGDRVFVTTAVAEEGQAGIRTGLTGAGTEVEEAVEHRWLVLAFRKSDGEPLWQTEVGRGVPLTRRHFKATQANSTPATDGRHLVVVFPTAGLACLGLDGSIHWRHELGGLNAGGFNDPTLQWGFASSPVLVGVPDPDRPDRVSPDRVVLQVDIHDGPYLAAWDLESGRLLWRTERADVAPSWSTPAVWRTPSGIEIVTNASTIHGYDPRDGRELWSLDPNSVQVVASPVVGDETLYVSAGYPPVKPIYALRPGIRGALEVEPGAEHRWLRWSHARGGAYMPTPLLYRGLLYVVHHNGRLVAYDAQSGAALYKERFSKGGTFTASPVVVNGRIYQGTEEGTLYVFAAGPTYGELASHDFGEPLMATPAISQGTLFVRTPSRLMALRRTP